MVHLSLKLEECVNRSEWITLMCPKANTFISDAWLCDLWKMLHMIHHYEELWPYAIFTKKKKCITIHADLLQAMGEKYS